MSTIENTFSDIKSLAKKNNVEVELLITGNERLRLGYQQRKLDKYEATQSQIAGFRVLNGPSCGYSYAENLSDESLKRAFSEALTNSQTIKKEGVSIDLPKPSVSKDMSHLYQPESVAVEKKHEVARELEARALERDARVTHVPYSGFIEEESWFRVMNSQGLDQQFKRTYYSGYSYPLAKQGEKSKCDGESFFVTKFADVDVAGTVDTAVDKVLKLLSAQQLKTGNYPVVLDKEIVGTFLQMLTDYFSAKSVEKGSSLLAGKLGQKIASTKFSLVDDPFDEHCTGTRPFDSEGSPSVVTPLFENGVFKNFLTNVEYAKKMNLPLTASASRSPTSTMGIGVSNLIIQKGQDSLLSMFKKADEMIYLTNIDGGLDAGFKEATGDFSLPAQGYLVKNGEIVGSVDQFVVSGNVLDLIAKIEGVGDTYNKSGSAERAPDLFISELSFAGCN